CPDCRLTTRVPSFPTRRSSDLKATTRRCGTGIRPIEAQSWLQAIPVERNVQNRGRNRAAIHRTQPQKMENLIKKGFFRSLESGSPTKTLNQRCPLRSLNSTHQLLKN